MGNEEERLQEDKKFGRVLKPYQGIIAAILVVIVLGLLVYFFFTHFQGFFTQIGVVLTAIQAVVIGVIIAYIVCPLMNGIEKRVKPFFLKHSKTEIKGRHTARSVSIACTLVLVIAVLVLIGRLIIPQIVSSITTFVVTLPENLDKLTNWLQTLSDNENAIAGYALTGLNQLMDYLEELFDTKVSGEMNDLIKSITTGVINVGKFIFNFIIGFIVAVYVLYDKEKFLSQSKKLVCTIFQPRSANVVLETVRETHEIFIGFIVGKIIDSFVIGILTYIVLLCFGMPYAVLVSLMVGVTNIVPFFGPFIGAVPSFFVILIADPIKGLIFIPIILAIQQIDGNIIGPKILGETTGLSTFWVIVAILLSGGLFGFAGMLLGVPLFAAIANIIKKVMNHFLEKKNLPTESYKYTSMQSVNEETGELCYERENMDRPKPWHFNARRKYDKAKQNEYLEAAETERKKHEE